MTDAELYNKAADMVEKGWAKRALAREEWGYATYPNADEATSWCLQGALLFAIHEIGSRKIGAPIFDRLVKNLGLGKEPLGHWNDHLDRTKEEVVTLLREAAARSLLSKGEENEM